MNRLTQKAPTTINIDGIDYPINSDARNCLNIFLAFENEELTQTEQTEIMLYNLYSVRDENDKTKRKMPDSLTNTQEAVDKAVEFLDCGEDFFEKTTSKRRYSLKKDSKWIISGMLNKVNGIDFNTIDYIHLWTWISHFMEMGECTFTHILYLREQYRKGKLTKEENEQCENIGRDVIRFVDDISDKDEYEDEEEKQFFEKLNS